MFKQPWRVSEREDHPYLSHFYRTEAIFNDIDGTIVKSFNDPREAAEFLARENACPPCTSVLVEEGSSPGYHFMWSLGSRQECRSTPIVGVRMCAKDSTSTGTRYRSPYTIWWCPHRTDLLEMWSISEKAASACCGSWTAVST